MAMASRLEINLQRLLTRCEAMAGEQDHGDWRLEKFVGALQEKLAELKRSPSLPSQEALAEYAKKIDFLKGLIQTEKLTSASDKAMASQLLAPAHSSTSISSEPKTHSKVLPTSSKDLHLQATSRYANEMRRELLETDDLQENGLRHRRLHDPDDKASSDDLDAVLQHHHNMQEKLAEEMLSLTRSLKHNTVAASNIIQEDNRRLGETIQLADSNYGRLKVESERLQQHTQRACNWWLWGSLLCVSIVFLWMIIFIRFFPKPR
ncbi:vesicle transport protein USE1-like [Acanthaster planci]|uniref:Vesicle transport protein USE1 n=1 Tax=Acanthaster planci TaxID=133434 RepID=A0A8B7YTN2_ACAPL|nr:vesicle transport protein USE1-like [Acanthaster planci]XP_022096664.1 vesicle transport protein USE1-like [Acanthaster planci]